MVSSVVPPRLRVSAFLSIALCIGFIACHGSDAAQPAPDASACPFTGDAEAELPEPARHTPRWAFAPWISKDISSTDDTYDFVNGFKSRGIPVGTVVLDSPWETNYNTFVPNPARYHDFTKLVNDMHADGVRVVLWTTQMINTSSFDSEPGGDTYDGAAPAYDEGQACSFFVNEGDTYFWWKGRGSGVDFTNARARAWWHRQQDDVLATGIDGWKLDFAENYILADPMDTSAGPLARQAYSEAYYRDFLAYGVQKRGADFTTMVRGWDVSYGFAPRFYAKKEDAPVVWAGDNRRDWVGLADALETIFRSANAGYVVVGSDIGGYLGFDDHDVSHKIPFDTEVFARWAAMGALTPFMQLHGQANITPWTVPDHQDVIVDVYKTYANLHNALVPFFYSLAEEAYATGAPGIVRPVGDESAWANDYRFMVGDAFLVAPIVATGGVRDVALPGGASWFEYAHPEKSAVAGGTTLAKVDASDWHTLPLFVREGAIVPMDASDGRTVIVFPGATASRFVVHDDVTTEITVKADAGAATITASRWGGGVFAIRAESTPTSVQIDGAGVAIATSGNPPAPSAVWDSASHTLRVALAARETPATITVK